MANQYDSTRRRRDLERIELMRAQMRGQAGAGKPQKTETNYFYGLVVLGVAVVAIGGAAYLFTASERSYSGVVPLEMDTITIKAGQAGFTTIRPYLTLDPDAEIADLCRALPRVHDAIVRELAGTPAQTVPDGVDLDAVRVSLKRTINRLMGAKSKMIEDVHVVGAKGGGTSMRTPNAVVKCGNDGDHSIVKR